jgi:hypothetical protein
VLFHFLRNGGEELLDELSLARQNRVGDNIVTRGHKLNTRCEYFMAYSVPHLKVGLVPQIILSTGIYNGCVEGSIINTYLIWIWINVHDKIELCRLRW